MKNIEPVKVFKPKKIVTYMALAVGTAMFPILAFYDLGRKGIHMKEFSL